MKTGRAYAFLNYGGRNKDLIKELENSKKRANFPSNLKFTVIDDKTDESGYKQRVPEKIADLVETTDVYGSVSSNFSSSTFKKLMSTSPVKASSLRYFVMAEAPGMTDTQIVKMLDGVLHIIAHGKHKKSNTDFSRSAVFYQNSKGIAERY